MAQRKTANIDELRRQADSLREKLSALRAELDDQPLVEEYDNGGGQTGTHANPWVVEYERMLKTYQGVVRDLAAYDEASGSKPTGGASPLLVMRGKYSERSA